MEANDLTPEKVAELVGGTVERDGGIVCCCPVHEQGAGHNPSMRLSITDDRRILFTCRSEGCDKKKGGFRKIVDRFVELGIPKSSLGGTRATREAVLYDYHRPDGTVAWTKMRTETPAGKKRFPSGVWDYENNDWLSKSRPMNVPLLYNLPAIKAVIEAAPDTQVMIVEGEKDVGTATSLGVLATTNADGAGKWRVEDARTLIGLGVKKVVVCPDNDGAGFEHGVAVAQSLQGAGVEVRWLELPELGMKEDLSDWAPRQVDPKAALAELIANAPIFEEESLGWRSRLKRGGRDAPYLYRGDKMNIELALKFDKRLKGRFAWNAFRNRVEVVQRTPWCNPDWWSASNLTPRGYRPLRDTDITRLGNYLTAEYDYGDCPLTACRVAINAVAGDHEFDELKDWLDAKPEWDGVARLDNLAGCLLRRRYRGAHAGIPGDGVVQIPHASAQPWAQPRRQSRLRPGADQFAGIRQGQDPGNALSRLTTANPFRRHGRARLTSRWPSAEASWRTQPKWRRGRSRRSKTRRRR